MAGLPRSFALDVTDAIMRFSVGYPRDRLRATAGAIQRSELEDDQGKCLVEWTYNGEHLPILLFDRNGDCNTFGHLKYLDQARVKYYGECCDACEPAALQLQRTRA